MRLILGLCALAARTGVAFAQARTNPPADSIHLSRRQVIADALAHNAQLEIAREQTAQARARRVSAIAVPDPTATLGYDQLSGPFSFRGAPSRPASLELDIPFPDKFRLNNRAGWADIRANESNYRLQQQTIALQASSTYDSLLVALQHRDNLREVRDLARDFLNRTRIRFDAGTAAKLDVIQAQVAVAQAETDLIGNERDVANAIASLNRTLGRVIGSAIIPTDSLDLPAPLPDSATIDQIAGANRPELQILQNQQSGAKASTGLAKEFWLPDLTFAVGRDYAVPGSTLFTTGLSFPLPVFYPSHAKGDIAAAQHYERELAAAYRDTRAQVTQDVRLAYANANTAMKQAVFIRDELVPAARNAYRIASTSYSLGGSSALEVLSARGSLLQALSQLADALADANTARADLDRALGLVPTGARR
jgi:cobalt-zinc-cadmium efflux system outer membrane protein